MSPDERAAEDRVGVGADRSTLAAALVRRLLGAAPTAAGYADWADPVLGPWHRTSAGNWVAGYGIAPLWRVARDDPRARLTARTALTGLNHLLDRPTSFNGFVFWYAAGLGVRWASDAYAAEIAVEAARRLAATAHPRTGVVPLGEPDLNRSPARSGERGGEADVVYVDPWGPTSALLALATELTGDGQYAEIAAAHAAWLVRQLIGEDGSVAQAAGFDIASGDRLATFTAEQGRSRTSPWARSSAWALLGTVMTAHALPEVRPAMLEAADRVFRWWHRAMSGRDLPPWDFEAPPGEPTDSSALAIVADALGLWSDLPGVSGSSTLATRAEEAIDMLVRRAVTATADDSAATAAGLGRGCYHRPRGLAVDAELIWGDWYLAEAVSRRSSRSHRSG